jgi:23S rRNA (adenine1618-N6)-methyltransferase
MVTPGGEVDFVVRMITTSVALQDDVQWYTTMLGKFSSISSVIELLLEQGVRNWAVTEFVQGNKTKRWGVAWSFLPMRPPSDISRNVSALPKCFMPFPPEKAIQIPYSEIPDYSLEKDYDFLHWMERLCERFNIEWKPAVMVGEVRENTWSRASRRKKGATVSTPGNDQVIFGFKVCFGRYGQVDKSIAKDSGLELNLRWIRGHDHVIFESFCAMLRMRLFEE